MSMEKNQITKRVEILLPTPAITSVRGEMMPPCPAYLVIGGDYGPELRTHCAAPHTLATLLGLGTDRWSKTPCGEVLSLDYGQQWTLHNAHTLACEAALLALTMVKA